MTQIGLSLTNGSKIFFSNILVASMVAVVIRNEGNNLPQTDRTEKPMLKGLPLMAKHRKPDTDATPPTADDMRSLEEEMVRLREEMHVLRESLDELREEFVHALRNQPEQLPPPLRVHSLPLDPTAEDFGERINAVPADVMARLRAEAAAGGGVSSFAAAAEGRPNAPSLLDGTDDRSRVPGRQKKLFA
jgi:hypothetical protein